MLKEKTFHCEASYWRDCRE